MIDFDKLPHFQRFQMKILDMIPNWEDTYQASTESVEKQVREAHAWILCNPKKAPKKNVMRFLNSWMASAERYHNLRRPEFHTPPPAPPFTYEMTAEEMAEIRKKNMG